MSDVEDYIIGCVKQNIELTPELERYARELYRKLDQKIFMGYKLSQIGPALGKVLSGKIRNMLTEKRTPEPEFRDVQIKALGSADSGELGSNDTVSVPINIQTNSLKVSDFLGINDLTEFKMLFNPSSMLVHYYLCLDSDYRDQTDEVSTSITKFTWNYAPTQDKTIGFCNSVGVIRDIIGMRMYQPRVPYLAAMDTDAKRVSVLIEEFKAQSFVAENGRRFHFLLRPNFLTIVQTDIELSTEDYNDGIYNFRKPITTLSKLTVSFGDPLTILSFSTPFNRFIIPFEFICYKSDK